MEILIDISNRPRVDFIKRKVRIFSILPDFINETIRCNFFLEHYVDDVLDETYFKTEFASLFTHNEKLVNQDGQRVELIEESFTNQETGEQETRLVPPLGAIPEFMYLCSYIPPNGRDLLSSIIDVVTFMVHRNDEAGNFNDMANFRE